jgi:hypothetical protein
VLFCKHNQYIALLLAINSHVYVRSLFITVNLKFCSFSQYNISLNNINWLVFDIEIHCVFCLVGTEFLNVIAVWKGSSAFFFSTLQWVWGLFSRNLFAELLSKANLRVDHMAIWMTIQYLTISFATERAHQNKHEQCGVVNCWHSMRRIHPDRASEPSFGWTMTWLWPHIATVEPSQISILPSLESIPEYLKRMSSSCITLPVPVKCAVSSRT